MINLSSMFAKSPFKPLRDHMDKVVESVAPLKDFFDALHQGNYSKVEEIQQQISLAEEEADIIKNEVRNHLPRNIFMPINRRLHMDQMTLPMVLVQWLQLSVLWKVVVKWPRNQICHFGFY